jgi:hypothetical protein
VSYILRGAELTSWSIEPELLCSMLAPTEMYLTRMLCRALMILLMQHVNGAQDDTLRLLDSVRELPFLGTIIGHESSLVSPEHI